MILPSMDLTMYIAKEDTNITDKEIDKFMDDFDRQYHQVSYNAKIQQNRERLQRDIKRHSNE